MKRRLAFLSAADGTRLCYELTGSGSSTLVLCDGLGCAGYIWKHFIPFFSSSFRILHGQYRGHGCSELPREIASMNVEQFAEDLARLLTVLPSPGPVLLVGHSMGVQVVLEFYRRYPEKVEALILINGAAGHALRYVHRTTKFAAALPTLRSLMGRWPEPFRKYWKPLLDSELSYLIGLAFEVNPRLTRREDFRPYFRDLGAMNPAAFFTALSSAERHSADDLLSQIKCPVLLIASKNDRFTPSEVMEKMDELIPGARLFMLPHATHIGPLERPDLLHEEVARFLRRAAYQKS